MSLVDIIQRFKNFNIMDVVAPLPETPDNISEYVRKEAEKYGRWKPEYKSKLDCIVKDVHMKYEKYINDVVNSIDKLANILGLYGDANLLAGNILGTAIFKLGSAGIKIINHLYQAVKAPLFGGYFADHPEDYIYLPWILLTDVLSAVPGATIVSPTFSRLVKYRMAEKAKEVFLKEVGLYKPWTTRLAEKLSDWYTGVKDRIDRVFKPTYQPELNPQPA